MVCDGGSGLRKLCVSLGSFRYWAPRTEAPRLVHPKRNKRNGKPSGWNEETHAGSKRRFQSFAPTRRSNLICDRHASAKSPISLVLAPQRDRRGEEDRRGE